MSFLYRPAWVVQLEREAAALAAAGWGDEADELRAEAQGLERRRGIQRLQAKLDGRAARLADLAEALEGYGWDDQADELWREAQAFQREVGRER